MKLFCINVTIQFWYFRFMRQGKMGGFRNELTTKQIAMIDKWSAEKMEKSDFKFDI